MIKSPGQLLSAELKRLRVQKTQLAERVGRKYATVNNWTKDKGFTKSARVAAARALNLPSDAFEAPSEASMRERHRRQMIDELYRNPAFADLTDEERHSVESVVLPKDRKATVSFYEMYVYLIRNKLERLLPAAIELNDALDASIRRKVEAHAAKGAKSKKPRKTP